MPRVARPTDPPAGRKSDSGAGPLGDFLADLETQNRLMLNHMSDGLYVLDREGRFRYVNQVIEKRSGIPAARFLGLHFLDLVNPPYHELVLGNFNLVMQGELVAPYELEYTRADGSSLFVEVNTRPILAVDRVIGLHGVSRDITARKKTEAAHREAEKLFAILTEHSPNMIFINTGGRITYVNRRCEEVMGYTREEFMAPDFDFLCLVAPEYRELVSRNFQTQMAGQEVEPHEYALITRTGERLDAHITTKVIDYQGGRSVLGIVTDISGLKKSDAALRKTQRELERRVEKRTWELAKSVERFRQLSELLPEIVFETDLDGNLSYANQIAFKSFGYNREDFSQGVSAPSLVVAAERDRLQRGMARLFSGQEVGSGEFLMQRKDGTTFPAIIHGNVILDLPQHIVGLRGVIVDISERKRAEDQLLAYQRKLKTLAAELMAADDRIRKHTASELHDIIAQNLALAKMKLSGLDGSKSQSGAHEALGEVRRLVESSIEGVRAVISELTPPTLYELGLGPALNWLVAEMEGRHELEIQLDTAGFQKLEDQQASALLYQAVRELLVNVTKHARATRAEVILARSGNDLRIEVKDDGMGFELPEGGFRAGLTAGYGLFSIRERLESIGGRIEIGSTPGRGTRVTLLVPTGREEKRQA